MRKRKDGRFMIDENDADLCFLWNRSRNGCVDGKRPNNRIHKCEWCLDAERRAVKCPAHPGWAPTAPK